MEENTSLGFIAQKVWLQLSLSGIFLLSKALYQDHVFSKGYGYPIQEASK